MDHPSNIVRAIAFGWIILLIAVILIIQILLSKNDNNNFEVLKMYDVNLIARYIVKRCNQKRYSISNLKLQKILYFVQAEFLVEKNKPCFSAEIEAWDFGPVVPEIYHKYKIYGSASIPYVETNTIPAIPNDDASIIDSIVDECGEYSASALVQITHNQAPWKDAYIPRFNNVITKNSIKKYFSED